MDLLINALTLALIALLMFWNILAVIACWHERKAKKAIREVAELCLAAVIDCCEEREDGDADGCDE